MNRAPDFYPTLPRLFHCIPSFVKCLRELHVLLESFFTRLVLLAHASRSKRKSFTEEPGDNTDSPDWLLPHLPIANFLRHRQRLFGIRESSGCQSGFDFSQKLFSGERLLNEPVWSNISKPRVHLAESAGDENSEIRMSHQATLHKSVHRHRVAKVVHNQQVWLLAARF